MADETPRDFKGLFIVASFAAALLTLGALWNYTKAAIIAEVVEQHTKDIAQIQLDYACSYQASMIDPDRQLATFIYCTRGKVSKDQVAK